MLDRKRNAIIEVRGGGSHEPSVVLTNCPACIQGLGRNRDTGIVPRHIAVELALRTGGENWMDELVRLVKDAEAITF
jgi:Fe-S oxidoreductase